MARIRRITPTARQRTPICHDTWFGAEDPIEIATQLHSLLLHPLKPDEPPREKGVRFVCCNIEITLTGAELHRLLAVFINPPKPKEKK